MDLMLTMNGQTISNKKLEILHLCILIQKKCSYEEILFVCDWIYARIDNGYNRELRCSSLYYNEKYHTDIIIDQLDMVKIISCVPELKSLFESIVENYIEIKISQLNN